MSRAAQPLYVSRKSGQNHDVKTIHLVDRADVENYVENHLIFPIAATSGSFGEIVPLTG